MLERCNLADSDLSGARVGRLAISNSQLWGTVMDRTKGRRLPVSECRARGLQARGIRWDAPSIECSILRRGDFGKARLTLAALSCTDL